LKIKKLAAVAVILSFLAAFPALAVTDPAENGIPQSGAVSPDEAATTQRPEERKPEIKPGDDGEPEKFEKKVPRKKRCRDKAWEEFVKDPLKALEKRRSEVQKLLKEGKISKEEAEEILKRIYKGIAEVKKFNKMSLEEKRAWLIRDCKDYLDSLVEKGEMEWNKAAEILEEYSEKIKNWNGEGYPRFFRKPPKPEKH